MKTRREFLQKVAASTATLPLISTMRAHAKPELVQGQVLKVAIMGLGSYGTRVADAMRDCKLAKLTGVISGSPDKVKSWQEKYGIPEKNCYNYDNFDQIRNNPDIDWIWAHPGPDLQRGAYAPSHHPSDSSDG